MTPITDVKIDDAWHKAMVTKMLLSGRDFRFIKKTLGIGRKKLREFGF